MWCFYFSLTYIHSVDLLWIICSIMAISGRVDFKLTCVVRSLVDLPFLDQRLQVFSWRLLLAETGLVGSDIHFLLAPQMLAQYSSLALNSVRSEIQVSFCGLKKPLIICATLLSNISNICFLLLPVIQFWFAGVN